MRGTPHRQQQQQQHCLVSVNERVRIVCMRLSTNIIIITRRRLLLFTSYRSLSFRSLCVVVLFFRLAVFVCHICSDSGYDRYSLLNLLNICLFRYSMLRTGRKQSNKRRKQHTSTMCVCASVSDLFIDNFQHESIALSAASSALCGDIFFLSSPKIVGFCFCFCFQLLFCFHRFFVRFRPIGFFPFCKILRMDQK